MNDLPALELEVYAPGLRDNDHILLLRQQLDLLPRLRYKIDAAHEVVYFEADEVGDLTQRAVADLFDAIGIAPRFVGDIDGKLAPG